MQDNKGWDFLEVFADVNENYIYQASKPWRENKTIVFRKYMRFAVACVVIIIAVAIGATHKNEVKAAWNKMTSLISRILGSTEDADDYVKQIQKTIRKNGIAVSLEEVAMDHENLWIAYSLSNESGDNDISMNSAEAVIDGKNLALEGQHSFNTNSKADDAVSKSYVAKFYRNDLSGSQKIDITIGTFKTEDDQIEKKDEYIFSFTATLETLAVDTKEIPIKESMQLQNGKNIAISKIKYNIFGGTIYGELPDMAENDEFLIRGEDDLGNELVFELNSYRNPDLVFDLTDSGISPNAKQLTLQLYYYADDAGNQFVYQDGDDEFYVEESSSEYGENENPEDRAVPVGDGFMIDLQE